MKQIKSQQTGYKYKIPFSLLTSSAIVRLLLALVLIIFMSILLLWAL